MITDPADYFTKGCGRCARFNTPDCSALHWAQGIAHLRELCVSAGLTETAKWGHPCYTFDDRNIAILGTFRDKFHLSFFNAALMKDPDGILTKNGPNTKVASLIAFTNAGAVEAHTATIQAYLQEAIGYAKAGIKPPKITSDLEQPEELISALDADPELAEAFHALTPGRQKSYVINLNGAKQSATRIARIAKFRNKIIAGKGARDR